MNRFAIGIRVFAIVFLIVLMHGTWAQAQGTAAEFYKKNPLTIVVPFGPGGGTDFYGRTMSAFRNSGLPIAATMTSALPV